MAVQVQQKINYTVQRVLPPLHGLASLLSKVEVASTNNLVELSNIVSVIQAKLEKIVPRSTSLAAVGNVEPGKGNRSVEKGPVECEPSSRPVGTSSHRRRKRRTRSLLGPSPE
jgi:hypothetical protein